MYCNRLIVDRFLFEDSGKRLWRIFGERLINMWIRCLVVWIRRDSKFGVWMIVDELWKFLNVVLVLCRYFRGVDGKEYILCDGEVLLV